jgi:ubiquinol-cytochrome c reductase cytochrome b subunit
LALQKKDRELLLHGYETGRIVRLPGGEYVELHAPVSSHMRWTLTGPGEDHPFEARPDDGGRLRLADRLRARASRIFFEDRLQPLSAEERATLEGARESRVG